MQAEHSMILDDDESLWAARDVAKYLKCSVSFVYKAAEDGRLPCLRIGSMLRFDPVTVRAFARGEPLNATVIPLRTGRG